MGVLSAALGLSLVGGGTWAAFNDTATINNHFAAGTLDLDVGSVNGDPINIDLTNMKPGDSVERVFRLGNQGSLAIKEVLLSASAGNFVQGNGTNADMDAFLEQFTIDFFKVDKEASTPQPVNVFTSNGPISLKALVNGTYDSNMIKDVYEATDGSNRINLAPLSNVVSNALRGIPVNPTDTDDVHVKITFKDDQTRTGGQYSEFEQNKFMDNSVDLFFNLEATQWAGVEVGPQDGNGEVNNKFQGSADDTTTPPTQPNPRTIGSGTLTPVTD